jgi:hypothetical protein
VGKINRSRKQMDKNKIKQIHKPNYEKSENKLIKCLGGKTEERTEGGRDKTNQKQNKIKWQGVN